MTNNNAATVEVANPTQSENTQQPEEPHSPEKIKFHEAKGKVVDEVRWVSCAEGHLIGINFTDNTCLAFGIVPGLILKPVYSAFQDGDEQILQMWGEIRSH